MFVIRRINMEEKIHTGLTYGVEDKPDLGTTIVLDFRTSSPLLVV